MAELKENLDDVLDLPEDEGKDDDSLLPEGTEEEVPVGSQQMIEFDSGSETGSDLQPVDTDVDVPTAAEAIATAKTKAAPAAPPPKPLMPKKETTEPAEMPATDPEPEAEPVPEIAPAMEKPMAPAMEKPMPAPATSASAPATVQTMEAREPAPMTPSEPGIDYSLWIIVGLIAALAAAIGIIAGLWLSRTKLPPAPHRRRDSMEEPTVSPALPAPENPAFVAYQEYLEAQEVSAKDMDSRMRDFAGHWREMRQNLRDLVPGDRGLGDKVEEARAALDAGDFDDAMALLAEIGEVENAVGLEKRSAALKHLMAAAIAKCVAGDLKMAHMDAGAAAKLYHEAVESLPPFQEDLYAEYLNKHGTAAYKAGDHLAAIASFERALQILEKKLGKNHPDVASALNNLALLYYSRGNYDAAEPLYKRSLSIDEQILGLDHPGVATDLNNLALLYKKQGNLEAAEPLLLRALEIKEKTFDPGHPSLVTGLKNYAAVLKALGRDSDAEPYEARASVLPPKRTDAAAE